MATLLVTSLNVNGFTSPRGAQKLQAIIDLCSQAHISFLQETHAVSPEQLRLFQSTFPGTIYWNHPATLQFTGTAICVAETPTLKVTQHSVLVPQRVQRLDVTWDERKYVLVNVYAPTHHPQVAQWHAELQDLLAAVFTSCRDAYIIVGGDFNFVADPHLDRGTGVPTAAELSAESTHAFLTQNQLVDIWRSRNAESREYSYESGTRKSRIDRFYLSSELACYVRRADLVRVDFSQHKVVTCSIAAPDATQWGRSYWKLNSSLLEEPPLLALLERFWSLWRKQKNAYAHLSDWWDAGKKRTKSIIIDFSREHANARKLELARLKNQIEHLEARPSEGDASCERELSEARDALSKLATYHLCGQAVRQRIPLRALEINENTAEWFAKASARRKDSQSMAELLDESGEPTKNQQEMLGVVHRFYQKLYSAEPTEPEKAAHFLTHMTARLTPAQAQGLDSYVTEDELLAALKLMQREKSPGSDGLTVEFYLALWHVIGADFAEVLNSCILCGALSPSMREAIIVLLFKKKGEKTDIRNWRPVSLLNADYKIFSKAMSLRWRPIMATVVQSLQACAVPGRSVQDMVVLLKMAQAYIQERDLSAIFMCADLEKAFDRVEHPWMRAVLSHIGTGPVMQRIIGLMYTDITSRVQVNGVFTEPISLTRSLRQGCAMSMLIYALQMEPLLLAIHSDPHIGGFHLPMQDCQARVVKAAPYADDVTYLLDGAFAAERVLQVCEEFQLASGCKINTSKTEILCLSDKAALDVKSNSRLSPYAKVTVKILGAFFNRDPKTAARATWKAVVEKARRALFAKPAFITSLAGKVKYIQTYVLSKLWYVAAVSPPNGVTDQRGKIESLLTGCLLDNPRWQPIARATLALPVERGGLNLPEISVRILNLQLMHIVRVARATEVAERPLFSGLLVYYVGLSLRTHFLWPLHGSRFQSALDDVVRRPAMLSQAVAAYKRLNAQHPTLDPRSLSTKRVYQLLIEDDKSPLVVHRPGLPWASIFCAIRTPELPHAQRDLNYKLLYEIYGFDRSRCYLCGSTFADLTHLLTACPQAAPYVRDVKQACLRVSARFAFGVDAVLFGGAGQGLEDRHLLVINFLLSGLKFHIWKNRQRRRANPDCRLESVDRLAIAVESELARAIERDVRRTSASSAHRKWSLPPLVEVDLAGKPSVRLF
jgi:exonuclease III